MEATAHAHHGTATTADDVLSDRDQQVLAFERQWWKYAGAKEQAIRDKFQMSATRYYQVLNALIDKPEALVQDPLLVMSNGRIAVNRLSFGKTPSTEDHR